MPLGNNVEIWDEEEQDYGGLDSAEWEDHEFEDDEDDEDPWDEDFKPDYGTTVNRKRLRIN